jgi:hypothetical protein
MEVHHHPHVEKKNFKEYFLEFLMIFLAVTLGFFAENLREYLKNNEDTRKSMRSMVWDLRSDSIMYSSLLSGNEYCSRMNDTLIHLLSEKNTNTGHMYFLARNITAVFDFVRPNNRTFEQLKTAGSLSLINNESILDSITSYYQSLRWIDQQNNMLLDKLNEVHDGNSLLFEGSVFEKIFSNTYLNKEHNTMIVQEPTDNPPFMSHDPVSINTVILRYHYFGSVLRENDGATAVAAEQCNRLIMFLVKKYTLE